MYVPKCVIFLDIYGCQTCYIQILNAVLNITSVGNEILVEINTHFIQNNLEETPVNR
jgi:hypothetical protein